MSNGLQKTHWKNYTCHLCGLEYFAYYRPTQSNSTKFCSRKCADAYRRTGKEVANLKSHDYHNIHKWLYNVYGKASKCEFCGKCDGRFHWAKKRDCEYDFKRENFLELCPKCHTRYDKIPEWNYGVIFIIQYDMNMNKIKEFHTINSAASELGILYTSISNALNGLSQSAGGYKWKYKSQEIL